MHLTSPFGQTFLHHGIEYAYVIDRRVMFSEVSLLFFNTLIEIKGIKYAPSICYEMLFPDELRVLSKDANILVHISDLGWFQNSWAKPYLLQLAKMRAIENQKPLLYVVNQGSSAFIYKDGTLDKAYDKKGTHSLQHMIVPQKGNTPYVLYGNVPLFVLFICIVFFIVIYQYKRSNKK